MKLIDKFLNAIGLANEVIPPSVPAQPLKATNKQIQSISIIPYENIVQYQAEPKKRPYTGPGTRVKELRTEKGWKQHNLATIAGCKRRLVSSIETGEAEAIDYQLAKRIAASLEVDVNYIWPKYSNK